MKHLVALCAALGACTLEEVPCDRLAGELAPCDLQPSRLRCDRLAPGESAALMDDLQAHGCAALWDAAGRPDPRACAAFGWECPEVLGATPRQAPTQGPLLFVDGIDARPEFSWSPSLLARVQAVTGSEVQLVQLPPWSTTEVRAAALARALDDAGAERVNLVCYAVAGLDCRYVVSPHGLYRDDPEAQGRMAGRVASITTIATPHHGTEVAREVLSATDTGLVGAVLGPDGEDDARVRQVLEGLTCEAVVDFDRQIDDAPGVVYQSFAGVSHVLGQALVPSEDEIERACSGARGELLYLRRPGTRDTMSPLLWLTAPYAGRSLTLAGAPVASPSDGMIAVESAKWGTFRGCLPADHYDVIGQFDDGGPDPGTGFEAARFYADLANDLAEAGL
jgi:triacylglycerol lipase